MPLSVNENDRLLPLAGGGLLGEFHCHASRTRDVPCIGLA